MRGLSVVLGLGAEFPSRSVLYCIVTVCTQHWEVSSGLLVRDTSDIDMADMGSTGTGD